MPAPAKEEESETAPQLDDWLLLRFFTPPDIGQEERICTRALVDGDLSPFVDSESARGGSLLAKTAEEEDEALPLLLPVKNDVLLALRSTMASAVDLRANGAAGEKEPAPTCPSRG